MYRTPAVAALTGATKRELHYWHRSGLVTPTLRVRYGGSGPEAGHFWSLEDARIIRTVVMLRHVGVSLNQIAWTGTVTVLRSPFHDWQGWLVVTAGFAEIVTDAWAVRDLLADETRPVAVLNLAHTALIEPEATVA